MKAKKIIGGPEQPGPEEKQEKKERQKGIVKSKTLWTVLFIIGVYIVGTVLFGLILQQDFWGLIKSTAFIVFTATLILAAVYNALTGKNALDVAFTVLKIEIIVLCAILVVPWVWGQAKDAYYKYHPSKTAPVTYAAPANYGNAVAYYDDSDPSNLGLGSHSFNSADYPTGETRWMGIKNNVSGWELFIGGSQGKKLLLIFSDNDTLRGWKTEQHKDIGHKKYKMAFLEPMVVNFNLN
jgi:hypothetical protein